eukprot:TRINITY_DN1323_c0_g1_i1.p1 TRINITY_DN1323_c0_g1~~TRINITY_DN1323_c0_g1_i1.p1  ORF type:complete len:406 (+),score=168.65 TRINITY_DN1323_c0_g1_i1:317-1534(+)
MDTLYALAAVVIGAIFVALLLAFFSNKAEDVKRPRNPNREQKAQKKKKTGKKPAKKEGKPLPTFTYDGEAEDDDAEMLKFIKGTDQQKLKEAKEERKRKQQAEKKVADASAKAQEVGGKKGKKQTPQQAQQAAQAAAQAAAQQAEEAEFAVVKQKKAKKPKQKKAPAAAAAEPAADTPAEGEESTDAATADQKADKKGGKRPKKFFKEGVFRDIRMQAITTQAEEEAEAAAKEARVAKGRKKGEAETEPAANEGKDKPAAANGKTRRPPRISDAEPGTEPERPVKERPKREAPPPPPRPQTGPFEMASLDDMLSAISTYYPTRESFFSKLPQEALANIVTRLSIRDVATLSRVNNFLSKFCRSDRVWRSLCERDFNLKFNKASGKKRFKNTYKEEFAKRKNGGKS